MRIAETEPRSETNVFERLLDAFFRMVEAMDGQRLRQDTVDGVARMQRRVGILKNHLHAAIEGLITRRRDGFATDADPASGDRSKPAQCTQDG